jgi:hypothetical protein
LDFGSTFDILRLLGQQGYIRLASFLCEQRLLDIGVAMAGEYFAPDEPTSNGLR